MNKTVFREFLREKEIIDESSLSRLYKHYKGHDSGTISACRGSFTKNENNIRTNELYVVLIGLGYSVTKIKGSYIETQDDGSKKEVSEDSFIVVDIKDKGDLKKNLIKLGEKFDQDSITFSLKSGEYFLIGTTKRDGAEPVYHQEIKLGAPMFGKDGEIKSKVNGRPFVFEGVVSTRILDDVYPLITRKLYLEKVKKYLD